jgi:hypothetical protein
MVMDIVTTLGIVKCLGVITNRAEVSCVTVLGRRASRPNHPGRATQTKTRDTARAAMRQKQYDESTFSARLAEALRRHRVAVRTARTSSSVMRDITDQLA